MNTKGLGWWLGLALVVVVSTHFFLGYRASSALERAVCAQGTDHACDVLRKTDARIALRAAWWMWPWNMGKSDVELREAFVAHFCEIKKY